MHAETQAAPNSQIVLWAGRIMSTLPAMLLLLGGAMNLIQPAFEVEGTAQYGYSESVIRPLGVVLLVCTVAYLVPRTSVLGKILLTGYLRDLGATHVQHRDGPIEIHIPVLFGGLLGGGLYLYDARVRALVPVRK